MTNQPYNGTSVLTCVYLIYVGAILLPLVVVNSGCECSLFGNCYASDRYSTFHHSILSLVLESCHCDGYVYYKWGDIK